MFVSFILRAILTFLKDILMVQGLGFSFDVDQSSGRIVFKNDRPVSNINIAIITILVVIRNVNLAYYLVSILNT